MTEREFLKQVSEESGISQKKLKECLDAMKPTMRKVLDQGEKITFRGKCTISVEERKERSYYNPKTGKYAMAKATRFIKVKIHDPVKDFLNRSR